MELKDYVWSELIPRYEFLNYGHALEIISISYAKQWSEVEECLRKLVITHSDITEAGGSESAIPKKFDDVLYPYGWREIRISGDLHVKLFQRKHGCHKGNFEETPTENITINQFVDGHNVDFIKGKVALDLEWNSKDQTFDRDILAMRTYFECGIIDVGIIVTRAENLNDIFSKLGVKSKYGASTTWIGKLKYRLDSRRQGGCPILAIGIKKENVKE